MRPEFLLLDVDGVLQFSEETLESRLQEAYNWSTSPHEFVGELLSHPEFRATQTDEADFFTLADKILPRHVQDLTAEEYMNDWLNKNIKLNQELIDRIPDLPATYLATNQDRYRGEYIETLYAPHVVDSFISYKMGVSKPSLDYFHHILRELKTPPENCVFIDDREDNILAARSVGIRGILFQDNLSLFDELGAMGLFE